MLADILDSLDTSQLAHQLDKFREQLEALNLPQSDYSLALEKLTEIANLLDLAQTEDYFLTKARKFDDLSQIALGLANEYQQTLSPAFSEEIKSFAETSKGLAKIYQELHILTESKVTQSSSLLPFLKHKGRDEEEQIQKNKPAMALLKLWLEERVEKQNLQSEKEAVESLKKAIDENRPIGYKLFDQR